MLQSGRTVIHHIVSDKVVPISFGKLLELHDVRHVDIIHIDTEGSDFKVLSTIDFSSIRPAVIVYEHMHLQVAEREASKSLLEANGYSLVVYDGDTLAFRRKVYCGRGRSG